jgi:hypothetical protein
MIIPCDLALHGCVCDDDPIVNLSAEAPDVNVFIGFRDFRGNPPLGVMFAQIGCKAICFSTTSQREADLCALRDAQACTWNTWNPPGGPIIPPGPDGGTHLPNTPGGIIPPPRNPIRQFLNHEQTCEVTCPDGTPFSETIPAGTVRALNQDEADEKAHSLACKFAYLDRICFLTDLLPSSCVGQAYVAQLQTEGGAPFANQQYEWEVTGGDFPPGLDLNFATGQIFGIPFVSGSYTFGVSVGDASGLTQVKDFTICIGEILTSATLPDGKPGDAYSTPLLQEPGIVASEVWTLVSGSLPDGITLHSNGSLQGNPTMQQSTSFTLQVVSICAGGGTITCRKDFTLNVNACGSNPSAFQDFVWQDVSLPGCSFAMSNANGVLTATPTPTAQAQSIAALCCNPKSTTYAFTAEFNWTGAGFTVAIVNATRCILRINGIDVFFSPFFNANGTFTTTLNGTLPLGTSQIAVRLVCTAGGAGAINGTCKMRPLTPP